MDIPVPKDLTEQKKSDEKPVEEKPEQKPVGKQVSKDDELRARTAALLESKEYHLNIKEKRYGNLLTFGTGSSKHKKAKVSKATAKKKQASKKDTDEKTTMTKKKKTWQWAVLAILAVAVVFAVDAGYLSLGFSLPFDIIKNN